jgi:hypothetical protein
VYYARPGPCNLQVNRTSVAVWRRHILSLPLAAGLPPLKRQTGGVCSLRSFHSAPFTPVAKPSSTAQRGRGSPRPVAGDREVDTNATPPVCVFFSVGRRPAAPASIPPQRGVLSPPCFSSSHHTLRIPPTAGTDDETSPGKLAMRCLYPLQPLDHGRTSGGLLAVKQGRTPYRRISR